MVRLPLFRFPGCFKSARYFLFVSFSNDNFSCDLLSFQAGLSITFPVRWKIALYSHFPCLDGLRQDVQKKRSLGSQSCLLQEPEQKVGVFPT